MSSIAVQTAPASEPLSLADMKLHLKLDSGFDDDDDWITSAITEARAELERGANFTYVHTTYRWTLGCWPPYRTFYFPKGQLVSVTSISYIDEDEESRAYTPLTVLDDYYVVTDGRPGRARFTKDFDPPSVRADDLEPVECIYTVGLGVDADAVAASAPSTIMALKKLVEHWYDQNRTRNKDAVKMVYDLLGSYAHYDETDANAVLPW